MSSYESQGLPPRTPKEEAFAEAMASYWSKNGRTSADFEEAMNGYWSDLRRVEGLVDEQSQPLYPDPDIEDGKKTDE